MWEIWKMKKIDRDGFLLCELQAKIFEESAESTEVSSEIFIRRFMNSKVAFLMDNNDFLPYHTMDPAQAIERILEAKNLIMDETAELQRQYKIFKRIRAQ
jgi:hypothetical protein